MNIIFASVEDAEKLKEKYIVLELDTIVSSSSRDIAWCVLTAEDVPVEGMINIDRYVDLHCGLIRNYKKQDFAVCTDIIGHLKGAFGGSLDTFYNTLEQRIAQWDEA